MNTDIIVLLTLLVGFAVAVIVGQAVTKYRSHRAGDVSLEEYMTFLDGCVLIAICLIFADVSPFALLAAALAAYGTILIELLHQVDKAALWLAQRHQTVTVPDRKVDIPVRNRYRK